LDADAPDLARYLRGHWDIEALHHIRDVTYAEGASRARAGGTPRVMATVRDAAVSLLNLAGWNNIAATRHMATHHA
jgi:predicted transposase YbfD/YdcC